MYLKKQKFNYGASSSPFLGEGLGLRSFILVFILSIFSSCGDFKEVTFTGIDNVKILNLSQQGVEAEVTAKIKNPNNVSFTVYSTDFDVILAGIDAGKAELSENVKIKANSEEAYSFKIKSDFSKLSMMDLPKLLSIGMSKNIKVELKGNLNAGKWFYKRTYPVNLTHTVPLGN